MADIRSILIEKLGRLPSPVSARPPEITRRFSIDGVAYERLLIQGPTDPIPAYLLIPEGITRSAPLLLALHPHGRQFELGKSLVAGLAGDNTRAYGLAAAKAGYAVFIPDLPCFEDRRPPLPLRKKNYALQGEAFERLMAMKALVEGSTLQATILSDLSHCLDILETDPRVDPSRIACLGQSFGGQEVLFTMLFDSRIRAGVSSCGFSLVRSILRDSLSHNMALYLPGMLPDLDFDTIVTGLAPRPLHVICGLKDPLFPVDGVRHVESTAREAYESHGLSDNLVFRYLDSGHDLPESALAGALDWLGQHLRVQGD